MSDVYLRYQGRASVRSFVKDDFARHTINDQGDVEFNQGNHWTARVSRKAAELLLPSGEFEKLSEKQFEADVLARETEEPTQEVPLPGEAVPGEKLAAHPPEASQADMGVDRPDYAAWDKAALLAEIDLRNVDRDEEDQLKRSGTKEDLVAVLVADNES